jgi:MFS family permease
MTACNFVGLALGPALAGALAQYAPGPLVLAFVAYLALVAGVAVLALTARETLTRGAGADKAASHLNLKPRLGVPADIRLAFLAPAAAGFAAMAVVGFYAALGPQMIHQAIGVANRAVSGAIVAGFFAVAALAIVLTRKVSGRPALLAGLAAVPPGLGLLAAAQAMSSSPLMIAATAICGAGAALSYRGGLAVANGLAPADRRAEVASTYFVCCFLGNALPVIGVTVLTQAISARVADNAFALVLSLVAVGAIACALAFRPRRAIG